MKFDYSKLIKHLRIKGISPKEFGEILQLNDIEIQNKFESKEYFSQEEILKLSNILDITPEQINSYFFTLKV